jgi:hypothetical protein
VLASVFVPHSIPDYFIKPVASNIIVAHISELNNLIALNVAQR